MKKEEVIKKLQKLRELADRGVGGESTNARKLYERLMLQYGIAEEELEEEEVTIHPLVIREEYLQRLIKQITACHTKGICRVIKDDIPAKNRRTIDKAYGKNTNVFLECTKMEFIQVMLEYDIYKESLKKSLSAFLFAFFQKNDLLVERSENYADLSKEEKKRVIEAMGYSISMAKTPVNKRIE